MSNFKWDDSKLKKEVDFTIEQKVIKGCFMIASDAKRMVKVDTGRLMNSISVNWTGSAMSRGEVEGNAKPADGVGKPTDKPSKFTVVTGTNVNYAIPQEYGTSKMAAHPYLRPALAKNLSKIKALFKGKL